MLCVPVHVYVHVSEGAYRPQEGTTSPAPGVTVMSYPMDAGNQSAPVQLCSQGLSHLPSHLAPALCTVADKGSTVMPLKQCVFINQIPLGQEVARTEKSGGIYRFPPTLCLQGPPTHSPEFSDIYVKSLSDTKWANLHRVPETMNEVTKMAVHVYPVSWRSGSQASQRFSWDVI